MADKSLITRALEAVGFKAAMRFPRGNSGVGYFFEPYAYSWEGSDSDPLASTEYLARYSIVMAAVNWLGRVLPEAPLEVVEKDSEGKDQPVADHPAARLWTRPNAFYAGTTMLKAFAYSWITDGNPYLMKVRGGGNQVNELWYVPPHMLRPRWREDGSEFIGWYDYTVNGQVDRIEQTDVVHFRDGLDPENMRLGMSPVASVLREIYTDEEIARYSSLLMKNGAVPPVVMSPKESLTGVGLGADELAAIKAKYQAATQGNQRGKVFVSGLAVDVKKMGFSPSELDLAQLRRMPEERLAAVIGIPAIVLGFGAGLDRATYANADQLTEYATETYLVPLWRYIEETLTHQLLPEFERDGRRRFKFNLREVRALQDDQNELYTRLTVAYEGGWLKRGEVRAAAGYPFAPEDDFYIGEGPEDEDEDEQVADELPEDPALAMPEVDDEEMPMRATA